MKQWFKQLQFDNVKMMYGLAALVTGAAVLLLVWFGWLYVSGRSPLEPLIVPEEVATEDAKDMTCERERHKLSGECLEKGEKAPEKVYAVMVENHTDARPQSGIAYADIVYEAPVEANYSRFMLLFSDQSDVAKIGPVRSARPYYLDWVQEYGDAMYVHVGGSPAALERITNEGINDLNEFYRGWFFWRSEDRYAPHNVYTSTKLLTKALADYEEQYTDTTFDSWNYQEVDECVQEEEGDTCIEFISVTFLDPVYTVDWEYDPERQQYVRYQYEGQHKDQDGTPIVADTIIVQRVETQVLDDIGRLAMETIGSGEALVFSKGNIVEGEWQKEDRSSRTQWRNADGKNISLQPGKIWIEVVNGRGDVTFE